MAISLSKSVWSAMEVFLSSQLNAIVTQLLRCIDGTGGGTYNNSSAIQIDGDFRLGGAKKLQYVSRSVARFLDMESAVTIGEWIRAASGGSAYFFWQHNSGNAGGLQLYFNPPHANVIDSITVRFKGATSGSLPGVMPGVILFRMNNDGTETLIASQVDTSANNAAYTATHSITISSIAHTIDAENNQYYVRIYGGSGGGGAAAGSFVYSVKATYTMTSAPEV